MALVPRAFALAACLALGMAGLAPLKSAAQQVVDLSFPAKCQDVPGTCEGSMRAIVDLAQNWDGRYASTPRLYCFGDLNSTDERFQAVRPSLLRLARQALQAGRYVQNDEVSALLQTEFSCNGVPGRAPERPTSRRQGFEEVSCLNGRCGTIREARP